jgi:hypothetical protein
MKRAYPKPTQIKDFFAASTPKHPVPADELSSAKQPLVVVKSMPDRRPKMITIPSLASTHQVPDSEFDAIWQSLSTGMSRLFAGDIRSVDFARLYQGVEFYCRFRNPKFLYDLLIPHMSTIVQTFVGTFSSHLGLEQISEIISQFEANLCNLRKIFMYFDRAYIFANHIDGLTSLPDIVHELVHKQLLAEEFRIDAILTQLRLQINEFRCDIRDDIQLLRPVFLFLSEVGFYDRYVEPMIIDQTQEFYSQVSSALGLDDFTEWFGLALKKEEELVDAGMKASTLELILKLVRKLCLEENREVIFGEQFKWALEEQNFQAVSTIFEFFDNDSVREIFNEHFGSFYAGRIRQMLDSECPIDVVIAEFRNAKDFVAQFGCESLQTVTRDAFDRALAQKTDFVSKGLASHFNRGLPITEDDLDFFKLARAREIFEVTYSFLLTKRILAWSPIDVVREQILIDYFKRVASPEYTERLELIIRDVVAAQATRFDSPSFSAMILSRQVFGTGSVDDAKFPPDVQGEMDKVADRFIGNEYHKMVLWSSTLSTATVAICGAECIMSGDQVLILMAIRDGKATVREIAEHTNLNRDLVEDNLTVLRKKRAGHIVVARDNRFEINATVTFSGASPIRFPTVAVALAQREKASVEAAIEYIKGNRIDCAIAQKMKIFKQLAVAELFAAVQKGLNFQLDRLVFLNHCKDLETKGVIEKCGEKTYKYLA